MPHILLFPVIHLVCVCVCVSSQDYAFSWILPEFRENLLNELRFRREGRNAEIAAANFARDGFRRIYIPKVRAPRARLV